MIDLFFQVSHLTLYFSEDISMFNDKCETEINSATECLWN